MIKKFEMFVNESAQEEDLDNWLAKVAGYLETDFEVPSHDGILDTFMDIVNDELFDLYNKGMSASDAAGTVAANEDALNELDILSDEDYDDEDNEDEDYDDEDE